MRVLDLVVLERDIDEHGLKRGDVCTIVHCYGDGEAFEVEFMTTNGQTIAVVTLTIADICPFKPNEILHVRDLAKAR
ncbi:MAG: DUF4926 domain-containing protein [Armatimonadetes bacterium]|nr:DUF4926 domain-containing protein [Armatimonadota bacterium]